MRPAWTVAAVALVLFASLAGARDPLGTLRVPDEGDRPGAGGVLNLTGRGIVIAVLDTGVDNAHPSLAGSYLAGAEVVLGVGVAPRVLERDPVDEDGHGTHVANLALGRGLADGSLRGVAPAARLVDVRIASSLASISLGGLEVGLQWVLDYNAGKTGYSDRARYPPVDVVSISFGSNDAGSDDDAAARLIRQLAERGVVVVVAAGNCGPDPEPGCTDPGASNSVTSPGAAPHAITVGALDDGGTSSRADDAVAAFSSRGPGGAVALAERKPNVVAPGVEITSAWPGGGRRDASGTSQAAPQVAGVAALLLEANATLAPADVKRLLQQTAADLGPAGWDAAAGWGTVDAYAAARAALGGNRPPVAVATADRAEVPFGGTVTFSAAGSRDPDGLALTYAWDVDGAAHGGSVVQLALKRAGNVTARLTVTDADGATASASVVVRVLAADDASRPPEPEPEPPAEDDASPPDPSPQPWFTWTPPSPAAGEVVVFDGGESTDDDAVAAWSWDFDEDGRADAAGARVARTFAAAGRVNVTLTVVDTAGQNASLVRTLEVRPPPDASAGDPHAPEVRILSPGPGQALPSPVRVEWRARDAEGVVGARLLVGGRDLAVNASGVLDVELPPGAHELRVEARDAAGNVGHQQVAFTVFRTTPGAVDAPDEDREAPAGAWLALLAVAVAIFLRRRR